MATWTTEIKNTQKGIATISFDVDFFKDSVLYKTHQFNNVSDTSTEGLKRIIRDQLNQYKKIDELDVTTISGVIDTTPPTPPTPPTPTQAELDRNTYFKAKQILDGMDALVKLGVKKATDQDYKDQVTSVTAKYKIEYLG